MNDLHRLPLDRLNGCDKAAFVGLLDGVFERSPWVAEAAFAARPFATVTALHAAMTAAVRAAPHQQQLALVCAHPELAGNSAGATMTADSRAEQGSLGLDRLSAHELATFEALNKRYREKFDFPFVICVRRHTRDSILKRFAQRINHTPAAELAAALVEIGDIARLRLVAKVDGPGMPKTTGRLSTHVLDTFHGRPAAGVPIALFEVGASARGLLTTAVTNADGRTQEPLIAGEPLRIGTYELLFAVGEYFARLSSVTADPPFLDTVPIRFSIAEAEGDYHVPLVVTPWSYSTYRGS